jgi:hypothetical protein
MQNWDDVQKWLKDTYEKGMEQVSKYAEKLQDNIESYAFDESKKKEYKDGFNTIGDGFQQVFKGLTTLATSSAKTISEWIAPKDKKSSTTKKPSSSSSSAKKS